MAKVNVNSASRDELVEAGVRADLADEIMKLRRKGRIESIEAIDAIAGVGPVTLEQLRKTLDFSDRARAEGEKAGAEAARGGREVAEKATDAAGAAMRDGAEAVRGGVETGARVAAIATQSGLEQARRTADAVVETERQTMRRAAEGTSELGQILVDMINAQTRHNLEVVTALSQTVDWDEVFRVQSEFMQASLERMSHLTKRYLDVSQAVLNTAVSAGREQTRRAA